MRRIPLVLAIAGVIAFGLAGTPAQAHDGWGFVPRSGTKVNGADTNGASTTNPM